MSHHGEKGQGTLEYALTLLLVAIVVICVVAIVGPAISKAIETPSFDQLVDQEKVLIPSAEIHLGDTGHPIQVSADLMSTVPHGVNTTHPRSYTLNSTCTSFGISGYTTLHAATSFPEPQVIEIVMPPSDAGQVNICIPVGSQIPIVLWLSK